MIVGTTEAKPILVRSKLPYAGYAINPCPGCAFGRHDGSASFTGRLVDQPRDAWGDRVYARGNAVAVFGAELPRLRGVAPGSVVAILLRGEGLPAVAMVGEEGRVGRRGA